MRNLLIGLMVLLVAPWAMAQGTSGSIELTPTVGYWFGDTLAHGTTGAFNTDVTIGDAPSYGLRLGYRFTPNWAFEAFLSQERADLLTGQAELFGGQSKLGNIDLTTGEVGFEGSFGHSRLVPFLAGGVGAMRLSPQLEGMRADTRFVGDFGGGLKLFFSPEVALRFDWRWHSVNVGNTHGGCDWWADCNSERDWLTFREVALGLTFVL
ncbi:MAG: outer membrane beta-barrel protein [Thermoanaerobaculales bacterium]|jgi:hypothetical protein